MATPSIQVLVVNRLSSAITGMLTENGVDLDAAIVEGLAATGHESEAPLTTQQRAHVADVVALQLIGPAKAALVGAVAEAGAGPARARFEGRLAFLESVETSIRTRTRVDVGAAFTTVVTSARDPHHRGWPY